MINKAFKGLEFSNVLWLFSDKLIRLSLGLYISTGIARTLGPNDYGLYNYATAIVAILGVLCSLGLNSILIKNFLKDNTNSESILVNAILMRLLLAIIVVLITILGMNFYSEGDRGLIIALMSVSLLFQSSLVIRSWFEAKVQSKYAVIAENISFVICSTLRVYFIVFNPSILLFSLVFVLESFISSVMLIYFFKKTNGNKFKIEIDCLIVRNLLRESWPLIISSACWIMYTRLDKVMISSIMGNKEVGIYSAAVIISDILCMLPAIIASSLIPKALILKNKSKNEYLKRFQLTYDLSILVAFISILFVWFFSKSLIVFLFGTEYSAGAVVLQIYAWGGVFLTMMMVSGRYMVQEGLQKLMVARHVLGLTVNVALNFILIPLYGIEGAAYASLLALMLSGYLFDTLAKTTTVCFTQKTKSIFCNSLFSIAINKYRKV
jgi:O-antigen/teichoic acid export membrane protein